MAEKYEQQIEQKINKALGNPETTRWGAETLPKELYEENNSTRMAFMTMVDKLAKNQCTPEQVAATLPKDLLNKIMKILIEEKYEIKENGISKPSIDKFTQKFKLFLKEHEKYKAMLASKESRKLLSSIPFSQLDALDKSSKEIDDGLKKGYQEYIKSKIERVGFYTYQMNRTRNNAESLKDQKWKNYFDKSTAKWEDYIGKEIKKIKEEMTGKYLQDINKPGFDWLEKLAEFKSTFDEDVETKKQQLKEEIDIAEKKHKLHMANLERVDQFDEFNKLLRLKDNDSAVNYVKNSPQYKLLKKLFEDHASDPKYAKYKSSFDDVEHEYFGNEANPGKLAETEYNFNLPIQFLLSQGGDIITGKTSVDAVLNDIPIPKELVGEKKLSEVIKNDKFSLQGITSEALKQLNNIQRDIYNNRLIKEYPVDTLGTPDEFNTNIERIEDLYKYAKVGNMRMIRQYIDDRLVSMTYYDDKNVFKTLEEHFNASDLKGIPNVSELRTKFADVETGVAQFREKWLNKNTGILADGKNFSSPETLVYQVMQAMDEGYEQIGKPYIALVNALLKSNYDPNKKIEVTNNKGIKREIDGSYSMNIAWQENGTYLNPNHRRTFKMLFRKSAAQEATEAQENPQNKP